MLHRNGRSGYPCVIPDPKGSGLIFSPLSMIMAMSLSFIVFIMLRHINYIPSFITAFIIKAC
jgi:hypothetical protein